MARHDGRVVFVRYALPGEVVRARVTEERGSHWHAEAVEIIEASPDRVDSLCPIAGVDGSGCCDLAFVAPAAARRLKGDVVANQLERLGGYQWSGGAEEVGTVGATGWRTRVRLDVGGPGPQAGRAGFHRYHSSDSGHRSRLRAGAVGHVGGTRRGAVAAGCAVARRARRSGDAARRAGRARVRTARRRPRRSRGRTRRPSGWATGPGRCRSPRSGRRIATPRRSTARWCGSGPGSPRA